MLGAIVYVLRTFCQGKALPAGRFGSASAIHARFRQWEKAGFFEALRQAGLAGYDELQGVAWRWQSIDGAMMKAHGRHRLWAATRRTGGNGSKRHLLVDRRGVLSSLIVTGAHRHDVTRLACGLSAIKVKRPQSPRPKAAQQTPVC